jgi:hypothetical protein
VKYALLNQIRSNQLTQRYPSAIRRATFIDFRCGPPVGNGAGSATWRVLADVRYGAHFGLVSDIARLPRRAINGLMHRSKQRPSLDHLVGKRERHAFKSTRQEKYVQMTPK